MPKIESSAVNDLIQLVGGAPLARDSAEDLLFRAPIPPSRPSARGTAKRRAVRPVPAPAPPPDETHALTRRVARPQLRKSPLALAALAAAGIAVGAVGYRLLPSKSAPTVSAPAAALVHAPTPAPSHPVVVPVAPEPPPAPALVELRFESDPAGASVMLVDNGKSSPLGSTPLAASVDPSRAYDVIFTLEGRPTVIEHVDPQRSQHVAVVLAAPPPTVEESAATPPPAPVASHHHHHHADKRAARKVASVEHAGTGTLMVSTKPPCDIFVDGKSTGLTTPQRAMALPAGNHRITLVNGGKAIKKTIAVTIAPDQTTKLIRDLMTK